MKTKTTTTEIKGQSKDIWATSSFIAELAAPALLIIVAKTESGLFQIALAVIAAILTINVLAKIHQLNRR